MKKQMKTIKEEYQNSPNEAIGFFTNLTDKGVFEDYNLEDLDIDFLSSYGNKWATPIFDVYDMETVQGRQRLSAYIYRKYKERWEHLYNVLQTEYNPISSYHEKTVEKNEGKDETTKINEDIKTNTVTTNFGKTENTQYNNTEALDKEKGTTEVNDYTEHNEQGNQTIESANSEIRRDDSYAYDSSTYSPNSKTTIDNPQKTTTTKPTDGNNTNKTTIKQSGKDTDTKKKTGNDILTEGGKNEEINAGSINSNGTDTINYGKTTTIEKDGYNNSAVEMLQKEIDFWKYNFLADVFKDLSMELGLSVY